MEMMIVMEIWFVATITVDGGIHLHQIHMTAVKKDVILVNLVLEIVALGTIPVEKEKETVTELMVVKEICGVATITVDIGILLHQWGMTAVKKIEVHNCKTVGGADVGADCVFPFIYKGQ